jgi:hypothetical protein
MTLPDERYRAVMWANKFLMSIVNTRSGLSKDMKDEARSILRHFPSEYDMDRASIGSPEVFQRRMEDVTRMFKKYEESKNEQA